MPRTLRGFLMTTIAALALAGPAPAAESDRLLTDFDARSAVTWRTVNDGVMGGRSRGGYRVNDGILRFAGSTNTNGGGFSSIRSNRGSFDLRGFDGIRLRVKADGRRYTFRLTTSTTRRGRYQPSYWADFETRRGAGWEVVDVPFERFRPQWRGRRLRGPALDLAQIDSLGLMIYDKRDGPFLLEADWIRAYRKQPAFRMRSYRGTKRPLLVFAPSVDDARLQRQLALLEKEHRGFGKRDMELIVVVTSGTSTAGSRVLTRAEVAALRKAYAVSGKQFALRLVGKDGGVKRKSSDVVQPSALFELIDTMPMRQREMRDRS